MNTERAQVGWRFWLWWVLASTEGFGSGKSSAYSPFARWIERWRVELLIQKPRDALPGVPGWAQRPEQLHGDQHEIELRDVLGPVEPQELDDIFVSDRLFHRILLLVYPLRHSMNTKLVSKRLREMRNLPTYSCPTEGPNNIKMAEAAALYRIMAPTC